MKVCIVTVYNSENCGSFLQAYALGKKIEELGHEVSYLKRDIKGTGASSIAVMKVIAKSMINRNFKNISLKLKFHKDCKETVKVFNEISKEDEIKSIDCFILGSDTIWYLDNSYFKKNYKKYWGIEFNNKKVISYAPSLNNTSEITIKNSNFIKPALDNLSSISVRDNYSKELLSKFTDKEINIVCDPTLLHNKEFYKKFQKECIYDNFILIYAFREFCSEQQCAAIKEYALKNNKKLISFGVYREWCDISVPFDNLAFTSYYEKAFYVITNTFHGTIFSIMYNKQFIDFAKDSKKVVEILKQFNLSQRNIDKNDNIDDILKSKIDYNEINIKLNNLKEASINYIKSSLR